MSDLRALVGQDSLFAAGENTWVDLKGHLLEGRAFQVRAGTITTPIVGDLLITDSAAEMCADAATGTTIIPTYLNIGIRLGTGILHEYGAKSIGSVSTAGTAFVPLPLMLGGNAALSTARVGAAGA